MKTDTLEKTLEAIDVLHSKGCKTVVISSAVYSNTDTLTVIASFKSGMFTNIRMLTRFQKIMNYVSFPQTEKLKEQ